MPLLTLDQVCLAYGAAALLDHANLVLESGERIGLIGRNGVGKSSLLRIVAADIVPDDGVVWRHPDLKLAFVAQEPALDADATVFDVVAQGLGVHAALIQEFHRLAHGVGGAGPDSADELARMQLLQTEIDHVDAWTIESRVRAAVERLDLDGDARVGSLSGGLKKRVAFARALVAAPELLLLDEPTNHLDIEGIEWLEGLLTGFAGGVLFVTHDRSFLDRVATRIVELDRGSLRSFPGAFSAYLERKQQLLAAELQQQSKFDKLLAQEEAWIRQGIEARRTRNEGRVRRLEQLRRERAARRERLGHVNLQLAPGERTGKLVAELAHVAKRYGDRRVVEDFSCIVQRGDKVGLIGPNGCGKTTLLRLLLGELAPDSGSVRLGTKLNVAYFDQFRTQLDEQATLAEVIAPGQDTITIGDVRKHVISYLGDFLFPPARARARVASLSGGERNRLLLARLFAQPANVLVLDEPTNDLDIETLELLETLLQDYEGTLFVVSHDRTFLDNLVTQTIAFEGNGSWIQYAGGYRDVMLARQSRPVEDSGPSTKPGDRAPRLAASRERSALRSKLSFKEVRELESLPDLIAALEREQTLMTDQLARPETYREQAAQVKTLREQLARIEADIDRHMLRWEELETRRSTVVS